MIVHRFRRAFCCGILILPGACRHEDKKVTTPLTGKATRRNLLLVTLDTTRADHIGCYGFAPAKTPTIDGLAKRGTLFEQAYAQAPLTMVSHTGMMTGLYPCEHGIHNNGVAGLDPVHPTLAKILKAKGYHTGAFVASYVLDSRFGLNAGFDTYDDDMGRYYVTAQLIERQRPANAVTDAALTWLDRNKAGPFFCWVHYYDPHPPYLPPPEFRPGFPHPYDGEIAFMDSQFKRIIDWLDQQKLADKTTIVVVGDHGEAFGEHGEQGHVMFLYEVNLHVPMIFVDPLIPAGKRINSTVEVTDIFPTILDLFGLSAGAKISSHCLSLAFCGQALPEEDCYSESHALFDSHHYAEQRSLTTSQWKFINSTKPELYDRKADPREEQSLTGIKPDIARAMRTRLLDRFESWTPGCPQAVAQTEESRKGLAALGYVGGTTKVSNAFLTPDLPDPKEKLASLLEFQEANRRMHVEQVDEAIPLLETLTVKTPECTAVFEMLGDAYLRQGRSEKAIKALESGVKLDSKYAPMWVMLGDAFVQSDMLDKAIHAYNASLSADNTNAVVYYKMATVHRRLGQSQDAIKHLRQAVRLRPAYSEAICDLAGALADTGAMEEAIRIYREAARIRPDDAPTRYSLGIALARMNQIPAATVEMAEAIRLKPDNADALLNLGVSLGAQDKLEDARRVLDAASGVPVIAAEGGAAEALFRLYLHKHDMKQVIAVLRKAADAAPENLKFTNMLASVLSTAQDEKLRDGPAALSMMQRACQKTNYQNPGLLGTLATAYAETGDFEKAVDSAQKAIDLAKSTSQPKVVEIVSPQLAAYMQKQPYRNPKY